MKNLKNVFLIPFPLPSLRCRFCTVDKADLSNPQVASEAPRRTKANTNNIIAAMSEMGVVERKQHETETGTLYSPNNQLFSDGIVIEPHIQVNVLMYL